MRLPTAGRRSGWQLLPFGTFDCDCSSGEGSELASATGTLQRRDLTTRYFYSGHASRKSKQIYPNGPISDAQLAYDEVMPRFPV